MHLETPLRYNVISSFRCGLNVDDGVAKIICIGERDSNATGMKVTVFFKKKQMGVGLPLRHLPIRGQITRRLEHR